AGPVLPLRGRQPPPLRGLVPGRLVDGVGQAQVWPQPEPVDAVAEVVPDVLLGGEGVPPVRVEGEGERVEMGGYVAGAARVGVVAPGAADVVVLLEDEQVVEAVAAQHDRGSQAAEAGTHDRYVDVVTGTGHY